MKEIRWPIRSTNGFKNNTGKEKLIKDNSEPNGKDVEKSDRILQLT